MFLYSDSAIVAFYIFINLQIISWLVRMAPSEATLCVPNTLPGDHKLEGNTRSHSEHAR